MRLLLLLIIIGAITVAPFVWLRRPWAVRLWGRIKSMFYLYVVVILISATIWLVTRWDSYYG